MTCVEVSDDLCSICCNNVVILNFLNSYYSSQFVCLGWLNLVNNMWFVISGVKDVWYIGDDFCAPNWWPVIHFLQSVLIQFLSVLLWQSIIVYDVIYFGRCDKFSLIFGPLWIYVWWISMNLVCYLGILSKMSSKRERKCIPEAGNKGKKNKVVENVDHV